MLITMKTIINAAINKSQDLSRIKTTINMIKIVAATFLQPVLPRRQSISQNTQSTGQKKELDLIG